MKENKRQTGSNYEQLAGAYLQAKGCHVIEYNYYCRFGEIDIIFKDGDYFVFCEVKYRRSTRNGMPAEAVDIRKQKRISKCAMYYLTVHGFFNSNIRFDVISVLDEKMEWIRDAFYYIG